MPLNIVSDSRIIKSFLLQDRLSPPIVGHLAVMINHSVIAIVTGGARMSLASLLGKLYGLGCPTGNCAEYLERKKKIVVEQGRSGRI